MRIDTEAEAVQKANDSRFGLAATLVTGDRPRIDTDRFDDHLRAAVRAEDDGSPSLALEHWLGAVDP